MKQKPKPAAPLLGVIAQCELTLLKLAWKLDDAGYGDMLQSLKAWARGGAYNPTAATLAALAAVLECDVSEIMPVAKKREGKG